jgi:hypothetical protein
MTLDQLVFIHKVMGKLQWRNKVQSYYTVLIPGKHVIEQIKISLLRNLRRSSNRY